MAYINILGKLKSKGLEGVADADQIAYSVKVDEDGDTVMDQSVKDVIDEIDVVNSEALTNFEERISSMEQALSDVEISDEDTTGVSVVALSLKVVNVETKVNSLFIELSQTEYDALEEKQEGVLYLIREENDTITE